MHNVFTSLCVSFFVSAPLSVYVSFNAIENSEIGFFNVFWIPFLTFGVLSYIFFYFLIEYFFENEFKNLKVCEKCGNKNSFEIMSRKSSQVHKNIYFETFKCKKCKNLLKIAKKF